jgi:SAM-dependent methyltransferase
MALLWPTEFEKRLYHCSNFVGLPTTYRNLKSSHAEALSQARIEYRSCVTDELKRILHSTIDGTHSNGWFNRTTFGYHSFKISNFEIIGQRKPHIRLEKIKKYYDFTNKRVLDFGCNNGGMLFHIPEIEAGLGIDFDTRCIDACHRIQKLLMFSTDYKFEQGDLNEIDIAKKCNEFKPDCVFFYHLECG